MIFARGRAWLRAGGNWRKSYKPRSYAGLSYGAGRKNCAFRWHTKDGNICRLARYVFMAKKPCGFGHKKPSCDLCADQSRGLRRLPVQFSPGPGKTSCAALRGRATPWHVLFWNPRNASARPCASLCAQPTSSPFSGPPNSQV